MVVVLVGLTGWSVPALPQFFGRNFEDLEWQEQQAKLPAYPAKEDLVASVEVQSSNNNIG